MKLHHHIHERRGGFSLIEITISAFVLIVLSGALTTSLVRLREITDVTDVRTQLQDAGERAIQSIITDARFSGDVMVGLRDYPYLFDDGFVTDANFAIHGHAAAVEHDQAGQPGFGVNTEVVLAVPLMVNLGPGQDLPSVNGGGQLQWSANEISYVVITGADGVNYLERRVNGANPKRVASYVERLLFEAANFGAGALPGALRVRIWFRRPDDKGVVHRHLAEVTVRLKNT